MALPTLSSTPKHHPDSCLSLSLKLIQTLSSIITASPVVSKLPILSIGSGTGLVEALLEEYCIQASSSSPIPSIEGVEVSANPPVNKYLSEGSIHTVYGTSQLSLRAKDAGTWMFVYPRTPQLVSKYVETFASTIDDLSTSKLRLIIWLGPRRDWEDFEMCFKAVTGIGNIEIVDDAGLVEYEMLVVWRRNEG